MIQVCKSGDSLILFLAGGRQDNLIIQQ